ncbi:GNAT family N-acetyltransferase [Sulfuriflexus sp.]|uniref:GNAT family N-acetyltransferase n=1 Tax=Sulfuriflexus sp. TaxID=2015443 RepID=UPI0028CD7512|nr:GNAT family N-acetyltransferase [Sulfuriflexus sp.]MDT8404557.1 GNAT family N-acetyltransferase [Sulfuriflexus sp.]
MTVVHQPEHSRFIASMDNPEARLEYELKPQQVIDFTYTFVPESQRGKGIAEELVRAGLAWAREEGFRVEASCWYVRRFLHG